MHDVISVITNPDYIYQVRNKLREMKFVIQCYEIFNRDADTIGTVVKYDSSADFNEIVDEVMEIPHVVSVEFKPSTNEIREHKP